jgi:hypothetical protein
MVKIKTFAIFISISIVLALAIASLGFLYLFKGFPNEASQDSSPTPWSSSVASSTPSPKEIPTLLLSTNTTTAKLNELIELMTSISPPKNGQFFIEWAINDSGFIFQTNETFSVGYSSMIFSFDHPGTWTFRAHLPSDGSESSAYSQVISVKVVP